MGLASKLAASQPPGGADYRAPQQGGYPPQQLQSGQKPGAYPGQGQYQAYQGATPQYPGRPIQGNTLPYPNSPRPTSVGAQPGYTPPAQDYPATPPFSPQPPIQQSYPQSQYGYQQPPYNDPQGYNRPPPIPPQQYGGSYDSYGQQQQQQLQSYPPQNKYSQPPVNGHVGSPGSYFTAGQPGPGFGQYPPHQQAGQQYGGSLPQQSNPQQIEAYKNLLRTTIQEKRLQNMIQPNDPRLDRYAASAGPKIDQLCSRWRIPREVGQDLVKLALFDIVLYLDNSGSMQFDEDGKRIDDLKLIISRVVNAAAMFDDDGISVRFMNPSHPAQPIPKEYLERVTNEEAVTRLLSMVSFSGRTPLGGELQAKVLQPLILEKARNGTLHKPVLIITVTDGQPLGEPPGVTLQNVIASASTELSRTQYGPGAVSFQFAQVGRDEQAEKFLAQLDSDPQVGNLIDCTSNFENEEEQMLRANPPVVLTPELWLVKMLLGAIDSSYDSQDEQGSRSQGTPYGGQGQYGAPPGQYAATGGYGQQYSQPQQHQQYPQQQQPYGAHQQGQPQRQYGAPQQGQYGAPQQGQYGAPQQGQYGAPQQGQYGTPQQGQYGAPPQGQYGAPPQGQYGAGGQGGYGAPPAPPRH